MSLIQQLICMVFETPEIFYELHRRSYLGVKSCNPKFKFGSSSMQPLFHEDINYEEAYYSWCIKNNCPIDFVNVNFYDLDFYRFGDREVSGTGFKKNDSA